MGLEKKDEEKSVSSFSAPLIRGGSRKTPWLERQARRFGSADAPRQARQPILQYTYSQENGSTEERLAPSSA